MNRLRVATSIVLVILVITVFSLVWLALLQGPLEFHTTKVCQLTGEDDRERPGKQTGIQLSGVPAGITGSDLGFPFEHAGKLRLLFGDTREIDPDLCEPAVCGTSGNPKPGVPEGTETVEDAAAWDRLTRFRDGADSIASTPLNIDPDQCLPLTFQMDDPEIRPVRGNAGLVLKYDILPKFHAVMLNGKHLGRFETPVSGFSDGRSMYAFFTVRDRPPGCGQPDGCALGDEDPGGQAKLAKSDDDGRTFTEVSTVSRGKFQWPVPVVTDAGTVIGIPSHLTGRVVLIWGTGREVYAQFRHSYPYLAVAPLHTVESMDSWRYYEAIGADGKPVWGDQEPKAQPLPPFGQPSARYRIWNWLTGRSFLPREPPYHKCLGEFSVGYIPEWQKWVMLYACSDDEKKGYNEANTRGIHLRTADAPWGPWSPPQRAFDPEEGYCRFMHHQDKSPCTPNPGDKGVVDTDFVDTDTGKLQYGGEYAPFLIPRYTKVDRHQTVLYFVMSTWNPYQSVLMRTRVSPPRPWDFRARWHYITQGF
jgi:hypothetical protein